MASERISRPTRVMLGTCVLLAIGYAGSLLHFKRAGHNAAIAGVTNAQAERALPFTFELSNKTLAEPAMIYGWSFPEEWGCWTEGPEACFVARFPRETAGKMINIDFDVVSAVQYMDDGCHEVELSVNDQNMGIWQINEPINQTHRITYRLPATSASVVIRLKIREPMSPADYGFGTDRRRLGLGISHIRFQLAAALP